MEFSKNNAIVVKGSDILNYTIPNSCIGFLFFALVLLFLSGGGFYAQDAAEIDLILESPEISYTLAANFIRAAAGLPEYSSPQDYPDTTIKLGELCFFIMKSFNIRGGFLYTLFPGPRYAYRELRYKRVLPEPSDPAMRVSGVQLLQITERFLNYRETQRTEDRNRTLEEIQGELNQKGLADTTVRIDKEGVIINLKDIQFSPDSMELMESEWVKIGEIARILSRYSKRRILIAGHTALAGTEEGRILISTGRAQAVADYIVSHSKLKADALLIEGYGAERPVADNRTAEGQALNRRVEIIILDRE